MAENTVRRETAPASPWQRYAWLVGAVVLALGLAFWLGRQQVSADFSAYRADQEKARQSAAATAQQLQAEKAALQGQVALLEGRRQMHLALLALDARNFGQAKQSLDRAGALLGDAATAVPALDRQRATVLQKELQSVRLVAAEDFSRQRAQIVAWARRWDALIPPTTAGASGVGAAAAQPPG